jgi:hypothetical protein
MSEELLHIPGGQYVIPLQAAYSYFNTAAVRHVSSLEPNCQYRTPQNCTKSPKMYNYNLRTCASFTSRVGGKVEASRHSSNAVRLLLRLAAGINSQALMHPHSQPSTPRHQPGRHVCWQRWHLFPAATPTAHTAPIIRRHL